MTTVRTAHIGAAFFCALAFAPMAAAQQSAAKVTVTVNNVLSNSGTIRAGLCPDRTVFGTGPCSGFDATAPAKTGSVELTFINVTPGTYALGIFHDENNDGQLSIFSEPMAFGNGATALPPIFDGAALRITGDLKTETALFKMVQ